MGTHSGCLVNRLFVSITLHVLIWNVLLMVYLSAWCYVFSLVSDMTIVFLSPLCQEYTFGVSYQSSISMMPLGTYFQWSVRPLGVMGYHSECLVNSLFLSMMSRVQIGGYGVFSIVSLSP